MIIDLPLAEMVFWRVCKPDFPQQTAQLLRLLGGLLGHLQGQVDARAFRLRCRHFFEETGVRWPRYDAWVHEQGREPRYEYDEDADEGPDYREMGELLAHRLVMAYNSETRRQRYLDNVADRPVWQLVAIEDGRTPAECLAEARSLHHCQSSYWRDKQLPCEKLFCRCRVMALTIQEAAAFIAEDAARP